MKLKFNKASQYNISDLVIEIPDAKIDNGVFLSFKIDELSGIIWGDENKPIHNLRIPLIPSKK